MADLPDSIDLPDEIDLSPPIKFNLKNQPASEKAAMERDIAMGPDWNMPKEASALPDTIDLPDVINLDGGDDGDQVSRGISNKRLVKPNWFRDNAISQDVGKTVDAFKESPGAATAGLAYGATAGLGSFALSLADIPITITRNLTAGMSLHDASEEHEKQSGKISEQVKDAIYNLLGKPDVMNDPNFEKAQSALGVPMEPFNALKEGFQQAGRPTAAAIAGFGGEAALGATALEMTRGKGKAAEAPKPELNVRDIVGEKPLPDVIPLDANALTKQGEMDLGDGPNTNVAEFRQNVANELANFAKDKSDLFNAPPEVPKEPLSKQGDFDFPAPHTDLEQFRSELSNEIGPDLFNPANAPKLPSEMSHQDLLQGRSVLKQAEIDHMYSSRDFNEKIRIQKEIEKTWKEYQEQIDLQKQKQIDYKFEEQRPTAMQNAFSSAAIKAHESLFPQIKASKAEPKFGNTFVEDITDRRDMGNYEGFKKDLQHLADTVQTTGNPVRLIDILKIGRANRISNFEQYILAKTASAVGSVPIRFINMKDVIRENIPVSPDTLAYYLGKTHEIHVMTGNIKSIPMLTVTLAHEAMHAITHDWIETNLHHPYVQALGTILEKAREGLGANSEHYGLTDVHELVAEAYSNPSFMDALKSVEISPEVRSVLDGFSGKKPLLKTIADAFYFLLGKILGFETKGPDNLLKATFDIVERMRNEHLDKAGIAHAIEAYSKKFTGKDYIKAPESRSSETFGRIDMKGEDWIKEVPIPLDDMKRQVGLGTSSFRSTNPLISNYWPAERTFKFADDSMHLRKEDEAAANHMAREGYLQPFHDHFSKPENYDHFRKTVGIALEMEKDRHSWGGDSKTKPIPTETDMVNAGMRPEDASMMAKVHELFDKHVWPKALEAAKWNGRKTPARVPGYIPHILRGGYTVQIWENIPTSGGTVVQQLRAEYPYFTSRERDAAHAAVKQTISSHPELTTVIENPKPEFADVGGFLKSIWNLGDTLEVNKGLNSLLTLVYENAAKGVITSILDRQKDPIKGHVLDRLNSPGILGIPDKDILNALKVFQDTVESVNGYHARARFVNETLLPLKASGFLDLPNLRKNVQDITASFFNVPDHITKDFNDVIRDRLVRSGFKPTFWRELMVHINSGVAKYFLVGNVPFYLANTLQWTQSLPRLHTIKALAEAAGEKTGDINKAIYDTIKMTPEGVVLGPLKDRSPLLKWAEARGFIEPNFVEHLDPGVHKDPVAMGIEARTRAVSFLYGYNYAKQIMPHGEALEFAGKFTQDVNVSYDRDIGQPLILGKAGPELKMMALFGTYNVHQLQNLAQQGRVLNESVKSGKVKPIIRSLVGGIIGLQAMNMALFGQNGLAMVQNYNDAIQYLNHHLGMDLPTTQELTREWGKAFNNKFTVWGIPSALFGYDMSSSAQGASVQLPLAFAKAIQTFGEFGILAAKDMLGNPPTKQELYDVVRKMPPGPRGVMEHMLKHKVTKEIAELVAGGGTTEKYTSVPSHQINEQGMPRTGAQEAMSAIGIKSLDEREFDTTLRLERQKDFHEKDRTKYLLQTLKEGRQSKEVLDAAGKELYTTWKRDPSQVAKEIEQFRIKEKLPYDILRAYGIQDSASSIERYLRYRDQRRKEAK